MYAIRSYYAQSGQAPRETTKLPLTRALPCRGASFPWREEGGGSPGKALEGNIRVTLSMYHSMALDTASAHDMIFVPLPAHAGRWSYNFV